MLLVPQAVSHTVQTNLSNLTGDCKKLLLAIDRRLAEDLDNQAHNRQATPAPLASPPLLAANEVKWRRSRSSQGFMLCVLAYFMLAWLMWVSVEELISTTEGKKIL